MKNLMTYIAYTAGVIFILGLNVFRPEYFILSFFFDSISALPYGFLTGIIFALMAIGVLTDSYFQEGSISSFLARSALLLLVFIIVYGLFLSYAFPGEYLLILGYIWNTLFYTLLSLVSFNIMFYLGKYFYGTKAF